MSICPFCQSKNTTTHEEIATILYGGTDKIKEYSIPYIAIIEGCIDCGKQWTGEVDEDRRDAVVKPFNEYFSDMHRG